MPEEIEYDEPLVGRSVLLFYERLRLDEIQVRSNVATCDKEGYSTALDDATLPPPASAQEESPSETCLRCGQPKIVASQPDAPSI